MSVTAFLDTFGQDLPGREELGRSLTDEECEIYVRYGERVGVERVQRRTDMSAYEELSSDDAATAIGYWSRQRLIDPKRRADDARKAIQAHQRSLPTAYSDDVSWQDALAAILTDLRLLADDEDLDFYAALERSYTTYLKAKR